MYVFQLRSDNNTPYIKRGDPIQHDEYWTHRPIVKWN